jgi:hypothetical protein
MLVSSSQMSHKISQPVSMTVGSATVSFSNSVKNLGFTLDRHLEMKTHVQNVVRAANFELRRIGSIRRFLGTQAVAPPLFLHLFFPDLITVILSYMVATTI